MEASTSRCGIAPPRFIQTMKSFIPSYDKSSEILAFAYQDMVNGFLDGDFDSFGLTNTLLVGVDNRTGRGSRALLRGR